MILRSLFVFLLLTTTAAAQDDGDAGPEREPYRDPLAASLKSAVVPGWFQFETGADTAGTIHLVSALLGIGVGLDVIPIPLLDDPEFSEGIGWGLYGFVALLSAIDANGIAARLNVENGYHLDLVSGAMQVDPEVRFALMKRRF